MKIRSAVLIAILATPLPLHAQDDSSIEARLRKLEAEVEVLKAENAQLRKDLGVEAVSRQSDVKEAGKAPLQLGGMIQAQAEGGDRGDSRFTDSNARAYLRRARLNVSGKFVEDFSFRLEMDLAGSLSNSSAFRAQMTDGYINWSRYDAANVRVGQFKTPFGFEQLYADSRLYTAERSLVSDRLTPGRQIGAQVGGTLWNEQFTYAAGLFNGSGTNQNFNDNDKFMAAARAGFIPFNGRLFGKAAKLTVGANGFRTTDANTVFIGQRHGIGYDAQLELGRLEVWSEYLRDSFEPTNATRFRSDGWYGQAAYYLIPNKLQVVERLETFDPSGAGSGDVTRSTVSGVNWYIKGHDLKLQLDWMRSRVPGLPSEQQKVIARLQTVF